MGWGKIPMIKIKTIPTDVRITVSPERMYLPHSLHESINLYWESLKASGKTFHRGTIFSIKEMIEARDKLHITLQKTDYAHFLYSKYNKLPIDYECRVIVANGLIVTKDNYIVLGEMNSRTASPGRLQFIAGGIDESDINQQSVNIFKSLIRETKEEIGVDLTNSNLVEKVRPRYIVHWGSVALVYLIQLAIDRSELQNRYKQFEIALKKAGVEPEFSSIILLSADCESISNFLKYDNRPRLDFLSAVLKKELNMG